mgnify:FL=1
MTAFEQGWAVVKRKIPTLEETGAFDGPWDECVGCGLAHSTPDSDYCSEECQSQNPTPGH